MRGESYPWQGDREPHSPDLNAGLWGRILVEIDGRVRVDFRAVRRGLKICTRDVDHTKVASRHELDGHVVPDGRGVRVSEALCGTSLLD